MFLDIKGGFDNVIPEILIKDLVELGLPSSYIKFYKNLTFSTNLISLSIANKNNFMFISEIGLPQGCSSSPILFAIYTTFIKSFVTESFNILQFADDLVIFTSKKYIHEAINLINQQVNVISQALQAKNLLLSPDKCKLLIFNKNNIRLNHFSVTLNDTVISPSNFVKFLGMIIDNKLTWEK